MGIKQDESMQESSNGKATLKTGGPLAESLKNREWPRFPEEQVLGDYEAAPWVKSGRVFSRALRLHQQTSESIPEGENAITSLCTGANGRIYGASSGTRSHLFYYDPNPLADGVLDMGVLPETTAVRRCLVSVGTRIYAAASETSNSEGGAIFVHDTNEDFQNEFFALNGPIERFAIPVKGEGIAALCADQNGASLYGLSAKSGTFFSVDVNTGEVKLHGRVSKDDAFSRVLVSDGRGNVYGTHSLGTLFRYSEASDKVEDLEVQIPTVAGREFYNQLDSAVYDPGSGLIFGAGTADGVLFSLHPKSLEMRSLGKVIAEPRVRAMTAGNDGRIYGIAGCEDGMGHLFYYDPRLAELRDLGIMMAVSEIWRRGFEFDAACTGLDGTLYFGESERDSNLFLYFPPTPSGTTKSRSVPDDLPY